MTTVNTNELATLEEEINLANYREHMYRLMSSVFAVEPTKDSLTQLIKGAKQAQDGEVLLPCERDLLSYLKRYAGQDLVAFSSQIRSEYAELFIGPRPPLAPLYESIYVGFPHRLYTETTHSVRKIYEQQGLAVDRRNKIPDDHIAYELEFMAALCQREQEALKAHNEIKVNEARNIQACFLEKHLGQWVEPFSLRIAQAENSDYYQAWSSFLCAFIQEDSSRFQ